MAAYWICIWSHIKSAGCLSSKLSIISRVSAGMNFEKNPCFTAALFRFVNWLAEFGLPLLFCCPTDEAFFFFFATLLPFAVATLPFFVAALRCHFSRFFLLRMVESFTPCFSAKSLNEISLDSHSLCIFS